MSVYVTDFHQWIEIVRGYAQAWFAAGNWHPNVMLSSG